ncbi:MAG: hypothetical protein M0C28_20170 [Candidatus Moduliflexus flocculans]|nr:hypothetical protein [Candidatus Moduliflexus flocculans]
MAKGPEEAEKILAADAAAPMDGYIVCQLNCWNRVVQTVAASGKPTLYVDFAYGGSGGFLVYTAGFLRQKTSNLGFVASSRSEDLVAACRAFDTVKKSGAAGEFGALVASARRAATPGPGDLTVAADDLACLSAGDCLRKMKESKILAVGGNWPGLAPAVRGGPGDRGRERPLRRGQRRLVRGRPGRGGGRRRPLAEDGGPDRGRRPGDPRHLRGHVPRPEGRPRRSTAPTPSPSTASAASTAATSTPIPASASTSSSTRASSGPASATSGRRRRW